MDIQQVNFYYFVVLFGLMLFGAFMGFLALYVSEQKTYKRKQ